MKALMIMPNLLLQRTSSKATSKENKETLSRRLIAWQNGEFFHLLQARTLQNRLPENISKPTDEAKRAHKFRNFMMEGKVRSAIRLLDENANSGILPNNAETEKLLSEKHPPPQPLHDEMLLQGPIKRIDPIIFHEINADLIQKTASRISGAAGPSNLDADQWQKILCSKVYGSEGTDLCHSIAALAKQLATEVTTDPDSLTALLACKLLPLDKNPGIRPIGVGEVLRRIISKAITTVLRQDLQSAAGGLQLCVGQEGGSEAGIHAMVQIYDDKDTHGIIQVDAENAFNTINRNVLL